MPKLAIDARRLVRRMSGIGHYVFQIARWVARLAPDFEVNLLLDRAPSKEAIPPGCNAVVLGSYLGDGTPLAKLYSPFWLNRYVPFYCNRARVDLFHGANFVLPFRLNCKKVATVHDISFIRIPYAYGPIYRRYMVMQTKRSLDTADAVIAISEKTREDLITAFRVKPEQITAIPIGIGDAFRNDYDHNYLIKVRAQLALPERYILHVGVVEVKKNIGLLLQAAAPLIKNGLVDGVVLAGRDGLGADEIRRLAKELGLANQAHFLGFVPQELLPGVYIMAKVVVFPSLYEGFGLPVLEAMACGTPVITSNISSLPEVAGDAALLVSPNNPEELRQALERVLKDEGLCAALRVKGLKRVREFTWEKIAAKHIEVYRRVLRGGDV